MQLTLQPISDDVIQRLVKEWLHEVHAPGSMEESKRYLIQSPELRERVKHYLLEHQSRLHLRLAKLDPSDPIYRKRRARIRMSLQAVQLCLQQNKDTPPPKPLPKRYADLIYRYDAISREILGYLFYMSREFPEAEMKDKLLRLQDRFKHLRADAIALSNA